MEIGKIMLIYFLLILRIIIIESRESEENGDQRPEQVVVRAVFINCELNDELNLNEMEATRFQREELFKHNALQGCHKKLALTVKIASEPDKSSGDEYIPIEHVFDGSSNKKRARLLDPYILRLRRDIPLQAYKLRRIDTVTGIISKSDERRATKAKKSRIQRNLDELSEQQNRKNSRDSEKREEYEGSVSESSSTTDRLGRASHCDTYEAANSSNPLMKQEESTLFDISTSKTYEDDQELIFSKQEKNQDPNEILKEQVRIKRDSCTLANNPVWKRDKRHEHNIIVEDVTDEYQIPWTTKKRYYRRLDAATKNQEVNTPDRSPEKKSGKEKELIKKSKSRSPQNARRQGELRRGDPADVPDRRQSKRNRNNELAGSTEDTTKKIDQTSKKGTRKAVTHRSFDKKSYHNYLKSDEKSEKNFVLYDIGNPALWYTVQVQLFEKMSNPEGKTVWNDITKGEVAKVSTFQPEWMDQDLNVRYKPTEWLAKDEFTLPSAASLCLLAPVHSDNNLDEDVVGLSIDNRFIVIPKDDIVSLEDTEGFLDKRDLNYSHTTPGPSTQREQGHRRVLVRVSRALLTDNEEALQISSVGSDRYLTLPHRRPHHAQIDLEARADENQLIRVGSSGSLITIVSDNSRRSRSVITVEATNRGLAAARFKVAAKDCGAEMASVINERSDGVMAGPIMVPPRHTQRFRLELPAGVPSDTVHCSVALINDDGESVAVRDVEIKKGDRCFCVWHCDCVCLNVDPKLSCREMPEARQTAAGLSPRERARRARSVCYADCVTINLFVIIVGVLMSLLFLGLVKACFGLFCRCVGSWGMHMVIQTPRKLEKYYEPALEGCCVVYDEEGWPVHPETKKRTVRLISKSMEFVMNVVIFIVIPALLLRDAIMQLAKRTKLRRHNTPSLGGEDKKCFSTHDMQGVQPRWRRRRAGLRRWMTPQAEELSTDIWSKGLTARKTVECEFMRPLLHERCRRTDDLPSSCADSEQDDTEYVLMQMQKSKESLARSQRKKNEQGILTTKKQINPETKGSHCVIR